MRPVLLSAVVGSLLLCRCAADEPAAPPAKPTPRSIPKSPPSRDLQLELDNALKRGDFVEAARLIEQGADVNVADDDGQRLIHAICNPHVYRDVLAAARFLKKQGADLTAKSKDGWPPIADATWWSRIDLMEFFAKNGADLTATQPGPIHRPRPGYTLLHIAALHSDPAPVQWLLKKGLEVDAKTSRGDTPLLFAAHKGFPKVVRVLLQDGADATVVGYEKKTARQFALGGIERWKNDAVNRVRFEEIVSLLDADR